jgi:hypothetical protein
MHEIRQFLVEVRSATRSMAGEDGFSGRTAPGGGINCIHAKPVHAHAAYANRAHAHPASDHKARPWSAVMCDSQRNKQRGCLHGP